MLFHNVEAVDYWTFGLFASGRNGFGFEEPEAEDAEAGCAGYGAELQAEAGMRVALPAEEGERQCCFVDFCVLGEEVGREVRYYCVEVERLRELEVEFVR